MPSRSTSTCSSSWAPTTRARSTAGAPSAASSSGLTIPAGRWVGEQASAMGYGHVEHRAGYRLWIGGPVPPGAAAWTLGSLVIVRTRYAGSELLLAHEHEHVRQWHDEGIVGFVTSYVGAYLRGRWQGYGHDGAYRRIPQEVRAEWRARRRL